MAEVVKVRRDGPRGWHLIAKAKYDANPGAYELADAPAAPEPEPVAAPPKRGRSKKSKE